MNDTKSPSPLTTKPAYTRNATGDYMCPHCDFTAKAKNPSTMFYHMLDHTGEKPHVCTEPGCDKAFKQKSGLTQHIRQVHTGAKGFSCPCCDHTATMKANMLIHIARKHGTGIVPPVATTGACTCSQCSKGFASATAYYYHSYECYQIPFIPTVLGSVSA